MCTGCACADRVRVEGRPSAAHRPSAGVPRQSFYASRPVLPRPLNHGGAPGLLEGAHHQPAGDISLHQQGDDYHRRDRQQGEGRQVPPLRAV